MGADPNPYSDDMEYALHTLVRGINKSWNSEPLEHFLQKGRLLFEYGADPNIRGPPPSRTAIHALLVPLPYDLWRSDRPNDTRQMLKFLVANGASVHNREEDGLTPLFPFLTQRRDWTASLCNIIDVLIKAGANVNESQGTSRSAIQTVLRSEDQKNAHLAVARLLSHGADANAIGGRYGTALHATVIHADLESARALLRYGATSIPAHCNYYTRNFLGTITNNRLGTFKAEAGIITPVELASKPLWTESASRTATIKREIQKKMKESANRAVA